MTTRNAPDPARHRRTQLREAKRAQRDRDRAAGLVLCQLKLQPATATALREALGVPGLEDDLRAFLDRELVEVARYPELALLCWNRRDRFMRPREAFALYERNWRFVDEARLTPDERALLERLAREYGNGVIHA